MYVPPASGQKVHTACTMFVQLSVRVSLSLSLAPHPKRFRSTPPKKISALSLSFLLRVFSGAAKAPWRPAPERIRSKNGRLGAQSFTRRYEMVRNTVTDRAPRAFKEQALGSRRAERASPEKADHSEQANQTPSKGGVRVAFFPVHEEDL